MGNIRKPHVKLFGVDWADGTEAEQRNSLTWQVLRPVGSSTGFKVVPGVSVSRIHLAVLETGRKFYTKCGQRFPDHAAFARPDDHKYPTYPCGRCYAPRRPLVNGGK